ncbi:MAG TPA: prephenate dehydratase domain-containing protein [Solirubrobacteraceae bacterium]|jgi:prephenate dehydratase|nr:prephenate dehydratase domain-containing protein [Solirubrobacteraceae bacterium]
MSGLPRVGYLGPAGTFTEEALLSSAREDAVEPVALGTIYDTVLAVREGTVQWAVVPIENSLDGSVTVTLDLLADEHGDLEIVGEALLAVRHSLIAAETIELGEIEEVVSHPQVPGQCTRLLRGELAGARVLPASSTAEAVRQVVVERRRGRAALGTSLAAEIYGGTVLREGVQDRDDNVTRFVWLARIERPVAPATRTTGEALSATGASAGSSRRGVVGTSAVHGPPLRGKVENRSGIESPPARWKTSVVFWGPGADSPGWLMRCLDKFARRGINLTKIESRPRRAGLGQYMFFADLQGSVDEPRVAGALEGLRGVCEEARVLGSYPAG